MADFDDAERHAVQEVEPADQVRWLLEDVDEDLEFFTWLQTQVAPPPGVPQLRCDCVAGLRSVRGTQPPWACLIEVQGQPLAGMAGREALWRKELEGFSMQESSVIRGWRKEGRDEGLQQGALETARAAVLAVLQARFPETAVTEGIRSAVEKSADKQQLSGWLREAAVSASVVDFERLLTAPAT